MFTTQHKPITASMLAAVSGILRGAPPASAAPEPVKTISEDVNPELVSELKIEHVSNYDLDFNHDNDKPFNVGSGKQHDTVSIANSKKGTQHEYSVAHDGAKPDAVAKMAVSEHLKKFSDHKNSELTATTGMGKNEEFEVPETMYLEGQGTGTIIAGTYDPETHTADVIFEHGIVKGVLLEGKRGRPKMARDASGKIIRGEGGKGVKASEHAAATGTSTGDEHEAEDAGDHHIVMQMHKVLSMKGNPAGGKTVEFRNGDKVKVPAHHAAKALYHYFKTEKPAQKEEMQKTLGASHKSFLGAIGEK